ncbi:MAG TPA: T6SS effector amidase Tae4 family protein [Archangium sp.]|nr:T6SS effector amidase Tae4 family protein [Archangium sp.]
MNKIPPEKSPCRDHMGNPLHVNQCAVRMGATLWSIHIRGFYGVRTCGQSGHEGHALSAEELGRWLDKQPAHFGKTQKYFRSHKPEEKLRGKTGIVLCWDFWDSDGDGRLDGEHIDVWDGHRMAHGSRSYISGASAVWFWALS